MAAKTQTEANIVLNRFQYALENLIAERLVGKVTPEQINAYYGFVGDCQIAEFYKQVLQEMEAEEVSHGGQFRED